MDAPSHGAAVTRAGNVRLAALAGLTAIAFVLRLTGMNQVLFGDELFTYPIVTRDGLWDALGAVHHTSITPPFHYVLAWASSHTGDARVTSRLPSLILGTATVPLLYALGARAVGSTAALVAAALAAISPFAIYYSTEARAYTTLMFLAALSTYALLAALETRRSGWWALYAISSCLVLYTHYSGVFVIAAQAGWALLVARDQRRALLASLGLVVLGYLPWVPFFLDQRQNKGVEILASYADLSPEAAFSSFARFFPGHPFETQTELPGTPALVLVGIVLATALAVAVARLWRRRLGAADLADPVTLVVVTALATPVGVLAWSLVGDSILLPRNLSASLPAFLLLVGLLLTSLRRPWGAIAVVAVLAAVSIGTVKTQQVDYRNSAFRDAAHYVDRAAEPGDPVIQVLFSRPDSPLSSGLRINFDRPHPVYNAGINDEPAWRRGERGARVFYVYPQLPGLIPKGRRAGPGNRFVRQERRVFDDRIPVAVDVYALAR